MITLHHLESSRSQRIIWLLEELGIDYQITSYKRDAKTFLAPPEIKKVHPLGKSPVIEDGELVLAESGAIVDYLVQTYDDGKLAPVKGSNNFADYLYWLHYAEGSAAFPIIMNLLLDATAADAPYLKEMAGKSSQAIIDHMDKRLSDHAYLAGDAFTAADIINSFILQMGGNFLANASNCQRYSARLQERSAYQRALQKGAIA